MMKAEKIRRILFPKKVSPLRLWVMADEFIVMLQILETKKLDDLELATKVSVQLQRTDPAAKARDRVVKKTEKDGFYTALDVGCVWLERALNAK